MLPRIFLTVAFALAFAFSIRAQDPVTSVYKARKPYASNELIASLEKRKDAAIRSTKSQKVRNHYIINLRNLKKMADEEYILHDHGSEALISEVLKKIVIANPQLKRQPQQVLIMRDTEVNAFCFGEGTFGITTGALSRIDSEAVLAVILTHEMSHYELDHLSQNIQNDVQNKSSKKINRGYRKIVFHEQSVTEGDIDSLKNWVYERTNFFREQETEADSLGLILLSNAGYYGGSVLTTLTMLDSAAEPKYHLGNLLHDSFNSTKVPFKDYWTSPRLSLFENELSPLFFSKDSLEDHPDLTIRRQKMVEKLGSSESLHLGKTSMFWNADLEDIESAILQKSYDKALLMALSAIPHLPEHTSYLKGIVAKILIDVYSVKDTPLMNQYVPAFIFGYSKDLKTVNAFLHNIHKTELGELAFDYINRKSNFNTSVEYHYFQLWRICNLTYRDELKKRVKKTYRDRFGKGEYYDRMDNQIQIITPTGPKVN